MTRERRLAERTLPPCRAGVAAPRRVAHLPKASCLVLPRTPTHFPSPLSPQLCAEHPPAKGIAVVKEHVRKMLHAGLLEWPEHNDELYVADSLPAVSVAVRRLAERGWAQPRFHTPEVAPERSWYWRHRQPPAHSAAGDEEDDCESPRAVQRRRYLSRSQAKRWGAARKRLRLVVGPQARGRGQGRPAQRRTAQHEWAAHT